MELIKGIYILEDNRVVAIGKYNHIPDWISEVLWSAAINGIFAPETIVLCNTSPEKSGKHGAYMYYGVGNDMVDTAICFIKGVTDNMRRYTLAHEIGHCDYMKRGSKSDIAEDSETYANRVAELLTGFKFVGDVTLE